MNTLIDALREAARRWPDRTAWTFDPGERFTFADVARLTAGYARALSERGVRPGDRVAVMLGNEPAFPLTWLALSRLGAAMVPVNTKYQTADAGHVLRASGASAIVAGPAFEPLLREVRAEAPGLRQVLPADEIDAAARGSIAQLTHSSDANHAIDPGRIAEPGRIADPGGIANIQFTSGTTGRPKGCLLPHRYWTQLAASLVTEFPYLTEHDVMLTAQPFHYIDPQWNDELVGTGCLGLPVGHRQVRIVDAAGQPVPAGQAGEITLAGPGMMDGYLDDPEATARVIRDGWLHTGDLGRMDEAGRVYHTGRLKDMIRRSGENISAREVEEARAYYVSDGAGPEALVGHCRTRLAAFKVPRFWQPAADLPRTDSERVAKSRLGEVEGAVFDAVSGQWSAP